MNPTDILSQDLPPTQEDYDGVDCNLVQPEYWGRLLSLNRYIPSYNLSELVNSFGRGTKDITRFRDECFDPSLFSKISKLHFSITRKECQASGFLVILEDFSSNGTYVNDVLVGRGNKKVLSHNDQIALIVSQAKVFVYYDCLNNDANDFPDFVRKKYTIAREIGNGTYGKVRLAYQNENVRAVAVKILNKSFVASRDGTTATTATSGWFSEVGKIQNEIDLLKSVQHPCIIQLMDIMEDAHRIFIVMELAEGGELFNCIRIRGRLTEFTTKLYFYQLVKAVSYLHSKKITHRDIKPENILLANNDEYTLIKLTDFGLSKLTEDASVMSSFCGTKNYIAPELLDFSESGRCYTNKVDIWSLGVVLYACLSASLPFGGKDDAEKLNRIRKGNFNFSSPVWDDASPLARNVISSLLVVDPKQRPSSNDVVFHDWFKDPEMLKIADQLMKSHNSSC